MADKDQVKPLHPATAADDRLRSDEEDPTSIQPSPTKLHNRRFIVCCGCCTAIILLLATVVLVLALTMFRIRDPDMTLNSVTLIGMSSSPAPVSLNATLAANMLLKNPNAASFNYGNGTAAISYDGRTVGEAWIPAGRARARRTVRMNVTVEIFASELLGDENVFKDLLSGNVTVDSYARMSGRVNLLKILKIRAEVVMNCTITMSVFNQTILEQKCNRRIKV